ncbi:hypothetical protein ACFLZZ_02650 [Nanoarchaeota archaeon]
MRRGYIFVFCFLISILLLGIVSGFLTAHVAEQNFNMFITIEGRPLLLIVSPENASTVNSTNVSLEFITDGADNIWYNLDDGTNVTITGNTTFDTETVGSHFVNVYANNSIGITKKTSYFTVSLTDDVNITWPEGVYEPNATGLVGMHKHMFTIGFSNLTANETDVLGCAIAQSNQSLLILSKTITSNMTGGNDSLNYTITSSDSVDKRTPWEVKNCTVTNSSGYQLFQNQNFGILNGRIHVHGNNWTRFDTVNDDAYRAGDCFLGIPKRYFNNTFYCDYAGDVAFSVTMSRGMNLEGYCHDGEDNDGNGNTDCDDIYCGGITYTCQDHADAGDPFAGSCTDGICSEGKNVGGQDFTYTYTRYVQPNGTVKFRIQGDGYSTSNPISFSITDLLAFTGSGKYTRSGYLGMPNEFTSAISYKTEDADGATGNIDYVFYVQLDPAQYTGGWYNVSLYVVQSGEDLLIAGIPIYVDSNALSNTDESETYPGVIDASCSDDADNDLDYSSDCVDSDCDGEVGGVDCSGANALCQAVETTCYDCFDNDADGSSDCGDLGCDLLQGNATDASDLCEYNGEGYGSVNALHNATYPWTVACVDNFDNDADSSSDCSDASYCNGLGGTSLTLPCPAYENNTASWCFDFSNNDYDSRADCADYDCKDFSFGGQTCPGSEVLDASGVTQVTQCFDNVDNDLDNVNQTYDGPASNIDCQDPDCLGVSNPSNSSQACYAKEFDLSESYQYCADSIDNDGDNSLGGGLDCTDPDCTQQFGVCGPCYAIENVTWNSCADSSDSDNDGNTDCADSDCSGEIGSTTSGKVCGSEVCNDGFDNDADGSVDCADSDCNGGTGPNGETCQTTESSCSDNEDNDADGSVDCADTDCIGVGSCASSWSTSSCITVPLNTSSTQISSSSVSVSHLTKHYVNTNYTARLVGTGNYGVITITFGDATDSGAYFPYNATTCNISGTSGLKWVASQSNVGQIQNDPAQYNPSNLLSGFDITLTCAGLGSAQSNSYPVTMANLEGGYSESGEASLTAVVYENTAPTVAEIEIEPGDGDIEYEGSLKLRIVPNSDGSGICKCAVNVSGTVYESSSGTCLITLSNVVSDTNYNFSVRAVDGAGNTGSWALSQLFSVDVYPKKFSSSIDRTTPFYNWTDGLVFSHYFEGDSDFASTCDYTLKNASNDIVSVGSVSNTGSGNLAICNGSLTVPSLDNMYRLSANISDGEGNFVDSYEKVFYVCNDFTSSGSGWTCAKADFDSDGETEGMYTSLYGGSLACDSCPNQTNTGQDIDADGIDAVCDADEAVVVPGDGPPSGCSPSWDCSVWSDCVDGQQVRVCVDLGDCETDRGKPEEITVCEVDECGDGTDYDSCSPNKPLYCVDGNFIDKCSFCGCEGEATCFEDGSCAIACEDDDECSYGYECEEGKCWLEDAECNTDLSCPLDKYCDSGVCKVLKPAPRITRVSGYIDMFFTPLGIILVIILILVAWLSLIKESRRFHTWKAFLVKTFTKKK